MSVFVERIKHPTVRKAKSLVVVLGDQLDRGASILSQLDRNRDAVLMVEAKNESEHVISHRQRTVVFLSAMRHFALDLIERGMRLRYIHLDDPRNTHTLGSELTRALAALSPQRVFVTKPGEHRVESEIRDACEEAGINLEVTGDESFTCPLDEFNRWAKGRKSLVMEYFYRERRRANNILVEKGKPVGGRWNFDEKNRSSFSGPPNAPRPYAARPDAITREVIDLVRRSFPRAPGELSDFDWPVTTDEAKRALNDFIRKRLPNFGKFEDAMWAGEPVLYHSRLSTPLNLKLLNPRACIDAALKAYDAGHAPINSVEGFVRQIVGWREFIRGVYYREGPDYVARNGLDHQGNLPGFFWTGDTEMSCLRYCLREVVENAWGHHIPRLMVIGNFAMIARVHPRAVHEWFLGMYADAVEWVTAPNVIGMSQHADGGVVGTKPYAASGRYIQRMSNYCNSCRFNPKTRTGDDACPFNVFYWDFLLHHHKRFAKNHRMTLALRNAGRIDRDEKREIRTRADKLRDDLGIT